MKNKGLLCLLLLCCVSLAFTGGFFVGRNANHSQLQLSTVPTQSTSSAGSEDPSGENGSSAAPAVLVNINTATAAQLQQLPGIGQTLAQRIIDYRNANGPFSTVSDLINVSGIGAGKLEAILDYITVGG